MACKDGRVITADASVRRLDLPDGTIHIGTLRDITARKRFATATTLLAEVGAMLSSPVEEDTRLEQVARLAVPALADWVAIFLVGPDDNIRQVAIAHAEPK